MQELRRKKSHGARTANVETIKKFYQLENYEGFMIYMTKINYRKTIIKTPLFLIFAILCVSCNSVPTEDFARNNLQTILKPMQVELTGFKKTNGSKMLVQGVPTYVMDVTVTYKFPEEMHLSDITASFFKNDNFQMTFVKKENGWEYSGGLPSFLSGH